MKTAMQELKDTLDKSGIYLDEKLYSDFMEKEKDQIINSQTSGRNFGDEDGQQ